MRYAVLTVTPPPGNVALRCFEEVSQTLTCGLQALGHDVIQTQGLLPGHRHIILAPNALFAAPLELPPDSILYNLEQLVPGAPWYTRDYLALLSKFETWDYSHHNLAVLHQAGIAAKECAIGDAPCLDRLYPLERDIDVCLFGLPMPRRVIVFSRLLANGVNAQLLYGVWGTERDMILARSKIVLNMHCIEFGLFEPVRCSYYLANGCFVISERGISPPDEAPWVGGLHFCDNEDMVGECLQYLTQPLERAAIAEAGRNLMHKRPIEAILEPLVGRAGS